MKLIDKDALVAEIKRNLYICAIMISQHQDDNCVELYKQKAEVYQWMRSFIDTLEVKEVGVWKTVDNINPPQADRNKIYCVLSKNKYLLARVINHPQDEDLLQWKCTEFPFHRYDMCEGDKYMVIY